MQLHFTTTSPGLGIGLMTAMGTKRLEWKTPVVDILDGDDDAIATSATAMAVDAIPKANARSAPQDEARLVRPRTEPSARMLDADAPTADAIP